MLRQLLDIGHPGYLHPMLLQLV